MPNEASGFARYLKDLEDKLVAACLNARDFCGNERKAIIDAAKEWGITLSEETIFLVVSKADAEYEKARNDLRKEEFSIPA